MEILDCRLINIASTSVPSKTEPPLIANPIPTPRNKPPKHAISRGSFVKIGKWTNWITKANPVIANMLLIANILLTCLQPSMIKGVLNITINNDKGTSSAKILTKSEIPVMPPSMYPFGTKKLSRPNPALNIPIPINIMDFTNEPSGYFIFFLSILLAFAILFIFDCGESIIYMCKIKVF